MRKEGRIKPTESVGEEQNNNRIKQMIRANERKRYCVEMVGRKMNENSNK
jgi:hypothetical protein